MMKQEVIMIGSYTFADYINDYYLTLLLLASLVVLLIVNHGAKITGLNYIRPIIGIVFSLTLLEALEDACDAYQWNYRILYFKTAMVYWLYPLCALLELKLIAPIRHKFLLLLPYLVYSFLVALDLFGTRIIYWFSEQHNYDHGPLAALPVVVVCFYVILLGIYSVVYISKGHRTRGAIALFMTVSSVITAIGERVGFARGFTESVTALEILIYYFFLASIDYSKTQSALFESRLDLERQRNKLLVAQMQPHFIFNSLATIQALCYTDSEAAADCIEVFGSYLRANIDSISSDDLIRFSDEVKHIEQYVKLEKASTDVNINVIYELAVQDFMIPPLTVQPIVENAIKHGALTRRDGTGFVKIQTEEVGGRIRITVTDNGTGASLTKKQKEHHSVGIQNVRQRLTLKCGGTLKQNITHRNGAVSVIEIPKITEKEEAHVHYWGG